MSSSIPKLTLSTRLLYIVAMLPFLLLAILYLSGAFEPPQDKPGAGKAISPSAPSDAAQNPRAPTPAMPEPADDNAALTPPPGKNAADFYKQAWGFYKQLGLTEDEETMLRDRHGKRNPEVAKALFAKIQPVVEMLRQATDATYADWGIKVAQFNTPLPQMNVVSKLAAAMSWNANYEFASDPALALSDLRLDFQMGHSVSDSALIGQLVTNMVHIVVIDTLRSNATLLSATQSAAAVQMMQSDDLAPSLAASLASEGRFAQSFIDFLRSNGFDAFYKTLGSMAPDPGNEPSGQLLLASYKNDPEKAVAEIQWGMQVEQQFAQKALLPDAEFNAWWQSIEQQKANLPFATVTLPNLAPFRSRLIYQAVQTRMLQAGLSVLQNGSAALTNYTDPSTGQSFSLTPNADGFELQSTTQNKGKPITMQFPTPKP